MTFTKFYSACSWKALLTLWACPTQSCATDIVAEQPAECAALQDFTHLDGVFTERQQLRFPLDASIPTFSLNIRSRMECTLMRCRTWVLFGAGLVTLVSFTMGCGSSSNARIRLVNAMPDESGLDLLVDSQSVATGVGYGTASGYSSVSSGSRHLQVEPTGTSIPIIDTTASATSGSYLTLISLNYSNNISSAVLTDDNSAPTSGNFKLRIVNASPGMGTQDVYVVAPGTDITSLSPTISSLSFGVASSYNTLAGGDYEVFFTNPGQKFINRDSGSLSFSAGQIRTILALNSQSGGFTSAVLADLN